MTRRWIGLGPRYTLQSSQEGEGRYHQGRKIRLVKYKRQSNSTRIGWILRVEVYMTIKSRRRGLIALEDKKFDAAA